jgi:hypothetical protein
MLGGDCERQKPVVARLHRPDRIESEFLSFFGFRRDLTQVARANSGI